MTAFESGAQGYKDFVKNRINPKNSVAVSVGQKAEEDFFENQFDPASTDFEDYWDGWCFERDGLVNRNITAQ